MFTQEVNVEAMYRATTLLFGDQVAMILAKIADTIDAAQQAAYELGLKDGQENLEAACDASFDSGWQYAEQEAEGSLAVNGLNAHAEGYDDGYLQGVQDARANPALADETVQDIINVRAEEHFEELFVQEYPAEAYYENAAD